MNDNSYRMNLGHGLSTAERDMFVTLLRDLANKMEEAPLVLEATWSWDRNLERDDFGDTTNAGPLTFNIEVVLPS